MKDTCKRKTVNLTKLKHLGACFEAVDWLRSEKFKSNQEAWDRCERGDWMMWLLGKLSGPEGSKSHKKLVLAACGCARLALVYVPKDELHPLCCIKATEAYARGETTLEELTVASDAVARFADYSVASDAVASAVDAAWNASYIARSHFTERSALAATVTYNVACISINRQDMALRECAEVVRRFYPKGPRL